MISNATRYDCVRALADTGQVEKLMSNIDREVRMPVPQGPFASELLARMPKDIIKSVSGSAAAAGSGEFHVYKNSRRREFERVKLMEEQQRAVSVPL